MEEARTKNIFLRNTLKKLEQQVGQKETLADSGLALIDFEQLKIENQTLNEKIEERNDELHKLRKKTTTTVQVLTHIKEKLQAVQQHSASLRATLGQQEAQLQVRYHHQSLMFHVCFSCFFFHFSFLLVFVSSNSRLGIFLSRSVY